MTADALTPAPIAYRWDLDKTYLRTEFDTVKDLLKIAVERAKDKRTVPGASSLIREIQATAPQGIYIVSGSPTQLRRVLEAKLRLDGVKWSGLVLKPQLRNILRGRFRFVKDQVGYKLAALFESRVTMDPSVLEVMFGDDAEADAFIYSLYADVCTGRVGIDVLQAVLESAGVYEDVVPTILEHAGKVARGGGALRIFIHLDRVSEPGEFDLLGGRVVPFHNYLQPALVLVEAGVLTAAAACRVACELLGEHGFTGDALAASYLDLLGRGHLGGDAARAIAAHVRGSDESTFGRDAAGMHAFVEALAAHKAMDAPEIAEAILPDIDWVASFGKDRARAKAAKKRAMGR